MKTPAPSLRNSEAAAAAFARHQHVEVAVVVDVGQFEIPRKPHANVRHLRGGRIGEAAGAVVQPQAGPPAIVGHVVARAPVGEHEVEIAVAVHVAGFEIADAQRQRWKMRPRHFGEAAFARAEEQPALRLVGRADDDVGEAVAVQVARLDDAREVRCVAKHVGRDFLEAHARPGVEEHLVWFRRPRRRVVAAVGEEQIGPSIAIEVGDLDLVGPVLRRADRRRGFVHPESSNGGRRL